MVYDLSSQNWAALIDTTLPPLFHRYLWDFVRSDCALLSYSHIILLAKLYSMTQFTQHINTYLT